MDAFHVLNAGCGGIIERPLLSPTGCEAEPTHAGLWYAAHGRTVWLGFACDRHADRLIAARPLLPRDRVALSRRRDRRRTELAGKRWAGEQEARSRVAPPPNGSSNAPRLGPRGSAMRRGDVWFAGAHLEGTSVGCRSPRTLRNAVACRHRPCSKHGSASTSTTSSGSVGV